MSGICQVWLFILNRSSWKKNCSSWTCSRVQEFINSRSSSWESHLPRCFGIESEFTLLDVNDLTTEKVTMKYSDTKWHDNHISSQLQASTTKRKIYNKSIASSHFFQSHPNTLQHPPPISTISTHSCFDGICYFHAGKPAQNHHPPTITYPPNPFE